MLHMKDVQYLNEKVGFKIPTTRYRKNSILCGALHIGTAKWTSGVGWSFGASRVAIVSRATIDISRKRIGNACTISTG